MIKNKDVLDVKPTGKVVDVKPGLVKPINEEKVYRDASVLLAGMPMGLLLTLTYDVNYGTVYPVRD